LKAKAKNIATFSYKAVLTEKFLWENVGTASIKLMPWLHMK